jgi:hypothetical protein
VSFAHATASGLIVALLLFVAPGVRAQTDAEALRARILERSSKIDGFKALLNDPNPTVRLAAFDEMVASGDSAMREVAIEAGLNSADAPMRALAFREMIAGAKTVALNISAPSESTKPTTNFVRNNPVVPIHIESVDRVTGHAEVKWGSYKGTGQLTGLRLTFDVRRCTVQLDLDDENQVTGTTTCGNTQPMPTTVSLR